MMQHMTTPPLRIRVTVSVTPETLEAFQHFAQCAGVSVGRAMGDWLGEQLNAVTFAALRFEEAREEAMEAPRAIARAVPGVHQLRQRQAAPGAPEAPRPAAAGSPPRPVIRGGNSPRRGTK
jgi:hypothetical protein